LAGDEWLEARRSLELALQETEDEEEVTILRAQLRRMGDV